MIFVFDAVSLKLLATGNTATACRQTVFSRARWLLGARSARMLVSPTAKITVLQVGLFINIKRVDIHGSMRTFVRAANWNTLAR